MGINSFSRVFWNLLEFVGKIPATEDELESSVSDLNLTDVDVIYGYESGMIIDKVTQEFDCQLKSG